MVVPERRTVVVMVVVHLLVKVGLGRVVRSLLLASLVFNGRVVILVSLVVVVVVDFMVVVVVVPLLELLVVVVVVLVLHRRQLLAHQRTAVLNLILEV